MRALLDYNPETGDLHWRKREVTSWHDRVWNTKYAGKKAGCVNPNGYVRLEIFGHPYWAHRVAWYHVHGEWPPDGTDHRGRIKGDNRIAELRPATQSQNMANTALRSDNTSGVKGVWRNRCGKWCAEIKVRGRKIHLGTFDELQKAAAVRRSAAINLFGEFASL